MEYTVYLNLSPKTLLPFPCVWLYMSFNCTCIWVLIVHVFVSDIRSRNNECYSDQWDAGCHVYNRTCEILQLWSNSWKGTRAMHPTCMYCRSLEPHTTNHVLLWNIDTMKLETRLQQLYPSFRCLNSVYQLFTVKMVCWIGLFIYGTLCVVISSVWRTISYCEPSFGQTFPSIGVCYLHYI